MKIIGEKLKAARILAGYTMTELADNLGITKQALSQYENNDIEPRFDIYLKILKVLKCKNDFLTVPYANSMKIKNTFFRASAAADAIERKNQEVKTSLVIDLYEFLLEYLELPKLNLPPNLSDDMSIEEKANKLREFWNLSNKPIKNIINVLEHNGIIVSSFNPSEGKLKYRIDGYTQQVKIKNDKNEFLFCIIVENKIDSWARKTFSLAHELGHIILHSSDNYSELSKSEQNRLENEANLFASAFLLPRDEFINDMKTVKYLNDFVKLKQKWFVSIGAMLIRAKQLGIISNDEYLRYIKNYSYHKYRKNEPLDNIIQVYQPSLFKYSLEMLFENGYTIDEFENDLSVHGIGLPLNQIEELLCLGYGFFDKYDKNRPVIKIKMGLNDQKKGRLLKE